MPTAADPFSAIPRGPVVYERPRLRDRHLSTEKESEFVRSHAAQCISSSVTAALDTIANLLGLLAANSGGGLLTP